MSERSQSNSEDPRPFKERYSFGNSPPPSYLNLIETRMKWSQKALEQYPNKLPLIIERAAGTQNDESLGKL